MIFGVGISTAAAGGWGQLDFRGCSSSEQRPESSPLSPAPVLTLIKALGWHPQALLALGFSTKTCLAPELAQGFPASLARVSLSRECPFGQQGSGSDLIP